MKKKIFFNKQDLFVLLSLFCLSFGLATLITLNNGASFSVLPVDNSKGVTSNTNGPLLKGQSIHAQFTASENNLGIISVRLKNNNDWNIDESEILFRIKEKGSSQWYYEQMYGGGNFRTLALYPFGFPAIPNSQGKTYIVELVSLNGTTKNALTFTKQRPYLVASYQFSKNSILHERSVFTHFLKGKLNYLLADKIAMYGLVMIFAPFFGYLFFRDIIKSQIHILKNYSSVSERRTGKWRRYLKHLHSSGAIGIIFFISIIYIFFLPKDNGYFIGYTMCLWVGVVWYYKLPSTASVISAIILLLFCSCLLVFHIRDAASKSAICSLLFLLIATAQSWLELDEETIQIHDS